MPASKARHQHRHYKTLIVLVMAMTGGTFLLFWLGRLSPVTPLRGKTSQTATVWNSISVRAESSGAELGFYHLRIDEDGWLYRSTAWDTGRQDRGRPNTIEVVLTTDRADGRLSSVQSKALKHVLGNLCKQHGISMDQVLVDPGPAPPRVAGRPVQDDF